jgi:hypothetical protein
MVFVPFGNQEPSTRARWRKPSELYDLLLKVFDRTVLVESDAEALQLLF